MKDYWTKISENIFTGVIAGGAVVVFSESDKSTIIPIVSLALFGLIVIKYVENKKCKK